MLLGSLLLGALSLSGCETGGSNWRARTDGRFYPPPPQQPRVVALGTLRGAAPPSASEVQLAMFLFGSEPPAPLSFANPTGVAAAGNALLVCDGTLGGVFRVDLAADEYETISLHDELSQPHAVDLNDDRRCLLVGRHTVVLLSPTFEVVQRYRASATWRPAEALRVGDKVWVTNLTTHRIEVFDLATGAHERSIGEHGDGNGQFSYPRGLALLPGGEVAIVDTLNNRVQVLSPDGEFLRTIGQAGDVAGTFGRPKDITVGPDGTIFVVDAFSQRVHAFDAAGKPLLAFGEPRSGPGALAMPNSIAIANIAPHTGSRPPDDIEPAYYILVTEQLHDPGVRVYAWLGASTAAQVELTAAAESDWEPAIPGSGAINPHWRADRCDTCHERQGATFLPIAAADTDRLCLSCHDGVQAPADPHPIGRPANTDEVRTPEAWPTPNGQIVCVTCHAIRQHCDPRGPPARRQFGVVARL